MQLMDRGGGTNSGSPMWWRASFCQTTPLSHSAISSSDAPPRRRERKSCSFTLNRQVRILPSAVSRMRLQWPQNGSLTGAMMPISPRPSGKAQRLAVADGIVGSNRPQVEPGLQAGENFVAGHDHLLEPGARGIERHEFDEAQAQVALAREAGQRLDFVVVEAADDDGVDLHRVQAEFLRQADARQDLLQTIAARDLPEVVAGERIQAETDAAKAGGAQRPRLLREEEAVGGHGQVGEAGNARDARDQVFDVVAQQRLAAGEPDFLNAEADREADDALNFLEGKDVRPWAPIAARWAPNWGGAPSGRDRNSAPPRFPAGNRGSGNCSGP